MLLKRRRFLAAGAALGAAALLPAARAAARPRVVIVGGGWAGLAAARHLGELAPEAGITLLERNARFWSCPLSNKWLVDQLDGGLLQHDYVAAARRWDYRFVQTEVRGIDRGARRVATTAGNFDYDWLVLAVGIRHDWSAWFGDDTESAALAQTRYPAAWTPGPEFAALREKLRGFKGGDLLLTIPPAPFRCPPAPYERAALLAGWFAERGIPARIAILDANPPFQEFQRLFREFGDRVAYRSQTPVVAIDLRARVAKTEFEEFGFDDAILMPPQQAGDLAWQAGLIGRDAKGRPTGWAAADPLTFASHDDERVFVIGDALGHVSDLFGHYPKSAHMAVRQGRLAALQIAARLRGAELPAGFPDSLCHIATRYAPPEAIRLAASYRLRGDGALVQTTKTERDPQPRGEDVAWLRGLLREVLDVQ
ncbi:MAG: NAD(P)/FAD-dependent oxidoreductase [Rhodocyclaceae bacterium]|nr:NAD(P)/FAD-dependent oxidoreductase [Rhodocyclaceae bacterium]